MELAARLLGQFAARCERIDATKVTIEVALAWATAPVGASPGWWAQRLGIVRCFVSWAQTQDPDTQVPPTHTLMVATDGLPLRLQRYTYRALIGLLSVAA